jgi:hypothetical protein
MVPRTFTVQVSLHESKTRIEISDCTPGEVPPLTSDNAAQVGTFVRMQLERALTAPTPTEDSE